MVNKQQSLFPRSRKPKASTPSYSWSPRKVGGTDPHSESKTVHFKMEGSHMLKDILKQGDWMTKVDLKDAYFMVPVATNQRQITNG